MILADAPLSDQLYAALSAVVVPLAASVLAVALHRLSDWAVKKMPWLAQIFVSSQKQEAPKP